MRTSVRTRYAGYRFPAEIIGHGVWLYFRGCTSPSSAHFRLIEEAKALAQGESYECAPHEMAELQRG
jgi:hypothetical protein